MRAKTVREFETRRTENRVRLQNMRKRVAEFIESQLMIDCSHLPAEAFSELFKLQREHFELRAVNWMPGGILVTDQQKQSVLFYWDCLKAEAAVSWGDGING